MREIEKLEDIKAPEGEGNRGWQELWYKGDWVYDSDYSPVRTRICGDGFKFNTEVKANGIEYSTQGSRHTSMHLAQDNWAADIAKCIGCMRENAGVRFYTKTEEV